MTNTRIPLPPDSRPCPCGAIAEKPHLLCHKCRARARWSRQKEQHQSHASGGYAYRIERRSPDGSWRIVATGDIANGRHPEAVARGLLERRVLDRPDRSVGGTAIVERNALAYSDALVRVTVLDRADRTALAVAALVPVQTPRHRIPRQRRSMNGTRRNRKEGSR